MTEKPAKGLKGYLLYNPFTNKHFFRIYQDKHAKSGHRLFNDYKLAAEDIEITIESGGVALFTEDNIVQEGNRLDWSSNITGKIERVGQKKIAPEDIIAMNKEINF